MAEIHSPPLYEGGGGGLSSPGKIMLRLSRLLCVLTRCHPREACLLSLPSDSFVLGRLGLRVTDESFFQLVQRMVATRRLIHSRVGFLIPGIEEARRAKDGALGHFHEGRAWSVLFLGKEPGGDGRSENSRW